jgi:hypothetical protein
MMGLVASGVASTVALRVDGHRVWVTADTDTAVAGALTVQVQVQVQVSAAIDVDTGDRTGTGATPTVVNCAVVEGRNVTNEALDGCDLTHMLGQNATFTIKLDGGASIYTLGFGA